MSKKKQYSYDIKCKELANHFLLDDVSDEMARALAQEIQNCVEVFFERIEARASSETQGSPR